MKIDRLCIDPGHGGDDVGATFAGFYEKDITLRISKHYSHILRALGWDTSDRFVIMTRPADYYISLEQRCAIANMYNADLFVSIHTNADPDKDGFGMPVAKGEEIWVISRKSQKIAEAFVGEVDRFFPGKFRGVKRGELYVLRKTAMPSILIETGFIDNPDVNEAFQNVDTLKRIALLLSIATLNLREVNI